jgi:hypothetical protein
MTSDPFQIAMIILLIAGFPFIVWLPSRITELMALGEEARVPEYLRLLANQKYLESIYEGEVEYKASHRWKFFVAGVGLLIPIIMLFTATDENFIPGLILILISGTLFFLGVAIFEWLVRPR